MPQNQPAHQVANQFVEINGRRLAYRVMGEGVPLLLCVRFRGTMDSWDPLFLDELAARGFRVHVFDYSGLGLSSGERSYDPATLARDVLDLIQALGLQRLVLGGWSLGGIVAQLVFLQAPQVLSHLLLLGTRRPASWSGPARRCSISWRGGRTTSRTSSSCSSSPSRRRAARRQPVRPSASPRAARAPARRCPTNGPVSSWARGRATRRSR